MNQEELPNHPQRSMSLTSVGILCDSGSHIITRVPFLIWGWLQGNRVPKGQKGTTGLPRDLPGKGTGYRVQGIGYRV